MHTHTLVRQWDYSLAGLVRLLLSVALVMAAGAAANATTDQVVFGTNFQEPSDTVSEAPPAATGCTTTSTCFVVFSPVSVGKRLIVTQISCRLAVTAGAIDGAFLKYQKPDTSFPLPQHSMLPVQTPSANFYVLNESTFALFIQARRPVLIFTSTGIGDMNGLCTISGQLIDTP